MKKFFINNHTWVIEEKPEKDILEEYHKRSPNAYACFGLTFYKEHKIWIAKELCNDEQIRTLKHELTHCYIWEYGFYNVDFNNEEVVCDIVAGIYDFMNYVLNIGSEKDERIDL